MENQASYKPATARWHRMVRRVAQTIGFGLLRGVATGLGALLTPPIAGWLHGFWG